MKQLVTAVRAVVFRRRELVASREVVVRVCGVKRWRGVEEARRARHSGMQMAATVMASVGASKLRFDDYEFGRGKSVSFDGGDCGCRVCRNAALVGFNMRFRDLVEFLYCRGLEASRNKARLNPKLWLTASARLVESECCCKEELFSLEPKISMNLFCLSARMNIFAYKLECKFRPLSMSGDR